MKGKTDYRYIVIIVILLGVIGMILSGNPAIKMASSDVKSDSNAAVEGARQVYSLITENPAEVVSVKEESGLYKVLLKTTLQNGQVNVVEPYVTKDGTFIINGLIPAANYTQQLQGEKQFAECLASKRVFVAGQSTDANTIQQMRVIGNFGYKIFFDCSGNNLQMCQQAGIIQIPATIVGNATYPGVQSLQFFETASGCKL